MTKPIDPYARVYWRVLQDERFTDIRGDMRHFGSWTLMLLVADMAYPVPAFVPPSVPRSSLARLTDCGLIEMLPGGLYRVHGMKAERDRRSAGRDPAGTPPGPAAAPDGTLARAGVAKPSQAETRQAEPSNGRADDALDTYYSLTTRYPTKRVKEWLTEIANEFGHRETGMTLAKEHMASDDLRTLLSRTEARLRSEAHHAELERAKPKVKAVETPDAAAKREKDRAEILREWSAQVKDVP